MISEFLIEVLHLMRIFWRQPKFLSIEHSLNKLWSIHLIKNNGEVLLILLGNVLQSIKCKVQSNMKKEAALWLKEEKKEKVLKKFKKIFQLLTRKEWFGIIEHISYCLQVSH